jgi:four helix bundle protein
MSKLAYARSHRDLIVYQKSRILANEIFELTKSFPKEETYSLTDQIRRSSRSVGAQIAEAWAKRLYEKHFISKLTDADAEQLETQHWIEIALDCGYIEEDMANELMGKCREIGRILNGMINKAPSFCNPNQQTMKEIQSEYIIVQEEN